MCIFFLMIRLPPRSTRTDTLFPYTTLFRSHGRCCTPGPAVSAPDVSEKGNVRRTQPTRPASRNPPPGDNGRSEEHTSELQSLMRTSYAVFCLKKKKCST